MAWFDQDYFNQTYPTIPRQEGLVTNVPCRHRREGEEEEHNIKLNFYSKKQLSLIIYKNRR